MQDLQGPEDPEDPQGPDVCPICHDPMAEGDAHALPDCDHRFHTACIVAWFRTGHATCPVCRGTPRMSIGFESVRERASRMLRRSRARRASPHLKRKADKYRRAQDRLRESQIKFREFRREHADHIREFFRIRRSLSQWRRKVHVAREELGSHGLAEEGLELRWSRW